MNTIEYHIEFFSYWHASSGLASSTYADLLVNKTREGLPYIPGRTLKGLLREAAETIRKLDPMYITDEFIIDVFGEAPTEKDLDKELATTEALCFFTNANLSTFLVNSISEEQKPFLFSILASTKIDEYGVATDTTLRQLEVTVPLILFASIENFPDKKDYKQQLLYCFQWIKRMGLNRSRGLGRCRFSMTKTNQT